MTNLRPGPGSCTPNWGTHDDRTIRDFLLRLDLACLAAAQVGPRSVGLAPGPATENPTSNPKESDLDCTHIDGATSSKTVAARRPSED